MKKRILSAVLSLMVCCLMITVSMVQVRASDEETTKKIDGSSLTTDESSTGYSKSVTRGQYLMDGECSISKAGRNRVYAYACTTANQDVDYIVTIAYVEQYIEEEDGWGQVDWFMDEAENDFFLSISKSVTVDRGYYYRVRANHIAGDHDDYPYDETASFTNGILVP